MRALITGANRGIGQAILDELTARGHEATGTHRGPDVGTLIPLDVTDPDSLNALRDRFNDRPLDALICNAGVYPDKGKSLDRISADDWASSMAVNVTGVFMAIRACLPALRRGANSRIGIIGSAMGSDARAPGGSYVYRASKAAVLNLGRNLATDLVADGITVQVFHPGWIATDMGGAGADLTLDQAVPPLVDQIEAMRIDRTGAFLDYTGKSLEF